MAIVTISFAKAHLSQLINRTLRGEEIVIARRSKPVAKLVAIDPARASKKSHIGKAKE